MHIKLYIKKYTKQAQGIMLILLVSFLGAGLVSAWTGPTAVPPNNNVSAPVNVGGQASQNQALSEQIFSMCMVQGST